MRTISHPNLPTVYEVLEDQGRVIVLEEYIDGMSVSAVLENGLYSEYGVQQVVSSVCDALEALHTFGIIHRDIKPENIMIDNDGHVTLIDFDAAKLYKPFHSEDTMLVGTAGYAAPEQFGIAQSDKRSDIFALGVLMNVMLTGDHPSKRMYHGKMAKIIQRCVQVDPNKRYPSAADLKAAINFIRPKQRA
ncbi:MAG: serine/threonine-protein kinase [Acutalibacteraceae bacterium]